MSESPTYPVSVETRAHALIDEGDYQRLYAESVQDPDGFWARQAEEFLSWDQRWSEVQDTDLARGTARWFGRRRCISSFSVRYRA